MRKPKDKHPKFKIGDRVLCRGQTAEVISEGWWDHASTFRYEIDFKWGKKDRKYKGMWSMREPDMEKKNEN